MANTEHKRHAQTFFFLVVEDIW